MTFKQATALVLSVGAFLLLYMSAVEALVP